MSKILNLIFITLAFIAVISAVAYAEEAAEENKAVAAKADADAAPAAAEKADDEKPAAKAADEAAPAAEKSDDKEKALPAAGAVSVKPVRTPRSLLQACRKEINRVCPEKKAIVKCLSKKVDEIQDVECKKWVNAREVCTKAASKNPKCTAKDSPRQCLRKVTTSELPEECTSSDFYKSVKMFSMFKRNPGKSGLLAKLGQK